jgi:hypothetical protein
MYIHKFMYIYVHTYTHRNLMRELGNVKDQLQTVFKTETFNDSTGKFIYICMYMYIHMHTNIHTYRHTHIHTYIHTFIHVYVADIDESTYE